ncbi:Transposase DDE domain-containing protein [Streptosporangium canum]|uniref:Transposase DDE domain-containing protein n=1 Tax=Streptosporangium canum TaxID=324952 RepID=A0A1I3WIM1_9ACTN|nr:Transposase DDE domain-containing protein [Streptosporangium canum]
MRSTLLGRLSHDADLYKERNAVERLINRLKDWRGIATRFGKTLESYLAGLELRASMVWLEDLSQAANRSRHHTGPS